MSRENIYIKRISNLREVMRQKNIEAFLVTHDDEHLLENTSKSFERLKWIIGFSGSAGYLLITLNELFLFVDSRYSIQSKIETKGLKIKIFNVFELNYAKFISKTLNILIFNPLVSILDCIEYLESTNKNRSFNVIKRYPAEPVKPTIHFNLSKLLAVFSNKCSSS